MTDDALDIPDFNQQNLAEETAGSESTLTGLLVWIDANENKPKNGECVDVYLVAGDCDSRITNVFYDAGKCVWWLWDNGLKNKIILPQGVTHWMHQPQPPEH